MLHVYLSHLISTYYVSTVHLEPDAAQFVIAVPPTQHENYYTSIRHHVQGLPTVINTNKKLSTFSFPLICTTNLYAIYKQAQRDSTTVKF